ncbi:MAG: hypothetical protein MR431_09240, partial [Clostridia bacterium]|nr:hypothetical protein [Clostridia bacterium]
VLHEPDTLLLIAVSGTTFTQVSRLVCGHRADSLPQLWIKWRLYELFRVLYFPVYQFFCEKQGHIVNIL